MGKSKISIITIAYNVADSIERTIKSVINQNYENKEYIIIDGGSTDGTVDIIKKYNNHIHYWISEHDGGIYPAMNKGILKASGDYLIFMNAGDFFVNQYSINSLAPHFCDENKIVYGYIIKLYNKGKSYGRPLRKRNPDVVDFILWGIDHQAAFIRKELFHKYGLYDTNYHLASDWFFFMNVAGIHKEKIEYVDKPIAYFSMDGVSTNSKGDYYRERNIILQSIFGDYFPFFCELAEYRKSSLIRWLLKARLKIKKSGVGSKLRFIQHRFLHK